MKITVGTDIFQKYREQGYPYVDKTALVREVLNGSEVILLPRPRRFGKTLNMTMLHSFFDMTQDSRALFEGLVITEDADAMTHLNAHPTLFLSLKALALENWQSNLDELGRQIAKLIEHHRSLLKAQKLLPVDRETLRELRSKKATPGTLAVSLKVITDVLYQATGRKTILLIDEYDAPIHAGIEKGYYEEAVSFFRVFLGEAFKSNPYLERAVLTGILRVAKESIFSGLNNLQVHSILDAPFSTCFGFTEAEVEALVALTECPHPMSEIRDWYNGYCFGTTTIYNPWSILNMLSRGDAGLEAHWVNTSENGLIRRQIQKGGCNLVELETLLRGGRIPTKLSTNLALRDMTPDIAWSLFLFAGYLTAENYNPSEQTADLYIPNFEVHRFFRDTVQVWLGSNFHSNALIAALLQGKLELFATRLQKTIVTILSYHDTAEREPEQVFHVFILGLLAHLENRYQVLSNRETGYGRADLQLIPRQPGQAGFVFEFKIAASPEAEALRAAASEALDQAASRDYPATLRQESLSSLTTIGLANYGKRIALAYTVQTLPDGQPSERTYLLAGPEPETRAVQEPNPLGSNAKKPPAKARKATKTKATAGAQAERDQKITLIAQIQLIQRMRGLPETPREHLLAQDLNFLQGMALGLGIQ